MNAKQVDRAVYAVIFAIAIATTAVTAVQAHGGGGHEPTEAAVVGIQGVGDGGQLVQVEPDGENSWHRTDAASYHDVTQINDSHALAAYGDDESEDCEPYSAPCGRTGFRVIDRSSGDIVRDWSYTVRTLPNSEVHDAEPLPDGSVLVVGMDRERVFTVDEAGEITWQWNASQQYDEPEDPAKVDWLHMNDVDRIGDGRYLVSVRNAHQLLVIDRGEGAVEVINKDRDTEVLNSQHNPQWLGDGRVLVADSENNRVVELERQNGSWEPVWSVEEAGGEPFFWPRDADRLESGETLITDSRNHRVVLVDENGSLVSEWSTPKLPYDAELAGQRESVGGPHLSGSVGGADLGPVGDGLQKITIGLHHTTGLPGWVRWWHIGVLGLAIAIRGVGDVIATRCDDARQERAEHQGQQQTTTGKA